MEVYQTIFELFLYFSEGLMIFYYARCMFGQKYSNAKTLAAITLDYAVLFLIYKFDIALLNVCFLLLISILIFIFLFDCNFKTAFFHAAMLLLIMAATEWISIFTISTILEQDFNAYQNNFNIHALNIIFSKTLYYLICIVIIHIFHKRKNKRFAQNNSIFWTLLIIPFSSLIVLLAFRYITYEAVLSQKMQIFLAIVSALVLITNIILFFLYDFAIQNWEKLYEMETEKQKQKTDENYMAVLEQNNTDLKILTHDIKNHLEQISNLNSDTAIKGYVAELYGTLNQYEAIGASQNKILDLIISKYSSLCANKNIEIHFNVKTANFAFVHDMDLSNILNNVLDNAVEATVQSERKKITVDFFSKGAFEVIKIKNSCDIPPSSKSQRLFTQKKDKKYHGLGIQSVQKTLKKYNGVYDWEYNENDKIFMATIAIPK